MEKSESTITDSTTATDDRRRAGKLAAAGGILGALGVVSTCCLLPFILFSAGISGAWAANWTLLLPYRPIFILATLGLLAYGFYCTYRKSGPAGTTGEACCTARMAWLTKAALWTATGLLAVGLVFDSYIEPLLAGL